MFFSRFVLFVVLLGALISFSTVSAAQNINTRIYTTHDGLASDFITAVAFEPNGSAWIGTTEGATHISNAGWISYTKTHGLGSNWVTSIAVAPDGSVWFGTQGGGLCVFDPTVKTFTTYNLDNSKIPSNFITALAIDTQNRVWVGTLNNGVTQFDAAQNKWNKFSVPGNAVTALGLDDEEQPWVGTTGGAFHWDGSEWAQDKTIGAQPVQRIDAFDGKWFLTSNDARFILGANGWQANDGGDEITSALQAAGLSDGQITAFGEDEQQRVWLGTPRGIWLVSKGNVIMPPSPLPVVLIHGWTVAGDDTLDTSEFHWIKSYADRDGIPMYYVRGVSPTNTLYQNAAVIRDEIARVKRETGASKVNMLGFSMGGMNTRAYLETALYGDDVNRAIILGTPQAGVDIWKPILAEDIIQKPDEPSAIELSPEYAALVNATRAPNPTVPYDLLIGDASQQTGLDFLKYMPESDALVGVSSALSLEAPTVRGHVNSDLHDWAPQALPIQLTGYLYPRETWERYLRNALTNNDNAPLGSEVTSAPPSTALRSAQDDSAGGVVTNHTPVVVGMIGARETVTRTVWIDQNRSARFISYFPAGSIDFSLIAPDGTKYEPSDLPRADGSCVLSLSTDLANFSGYVVKNAQVGEWKMRLTRADGGHQALRVSSYVELDAPQYLQVSVDKMVSLGADILVKAQLAEPVPGVTMTAQIAEPAAQSGQPFQMSDVELFDDGQHNDGAASDGVFANSFKPARGGWYAVWVDAGSSTVERGTENLVQVNPGDAQIELKSSTMEPQTSAVTLNIGVTSERAGQFAVSGRLTNKETGTIAARVFVPTPLRAGTNSVPLAFDTSRLEPGQYTLNLILLDANWAAFELDHADFPVAISLP